MNHVNHTDHTYVAIDLKSFYASVECVERHLDPLNTNLVVADASRTDKTICLAVSPSLKAYGIPGRARLFEVIQRVKDINRDRFRIAFRNHLIRPDQNGNCRFVSSSFYAPALQNDPSLQLSYIVAPPRMKLYEKYSSHIYSVYLKYVAPEDIFVYSIDEVFIDVTAYLRTYHMTAHELTMTMIREVLYTTGITATAGIGTNFFLAKVAMDIVSKHISPDKDGVRVAELDEKSYRQLLWSHRPLTDFWHIGQGYYRKLNTLGLHTMGDIARASLSPERRNQLFKIFGIHAEILIDHAWGLEPTTMQAIKSYRPDTKSLSSGQVLKEPYSYENARLIVKEMSELLTHDLVRKGYVTRQMILTIGYDRESLILTVPGRSIPESIYTVRTTGKLYRGKVTPDPYGRPHPYHAHGTENLPGYTNSVRRIMSAVSSLYQRIVNPDLLVRRISIAACGLIRENAVPESPPEQLDFFTDYALLEQQRRTEQLRELKERDLLRTVLVLQDRYGKNAVLRGMNYLKAGTTIERNHQIGGHKA